MEEQPRRQPIAKGAENILAHEEAKGKAGPYEKAKKKARIEPYAKGKGKGRGLQGKGKAPCGSGWYSWCGANKVPTSWYTWYEGWYGRMDLC